MGCKSCENKRNKHQPKEHNIFKRAFNFGLAVTKYVSSGLEDVSSKEYERRLRVCSECEQLASLNGLLDKCLICGCKITLKAKWATEKCPHPDSNKWS